MTYVISALIPCYNILSPSLTPLSRQATKRDTATLEVAPPPLYTTGDDALGVRFDLFCLMQKGIVDL